MNTEKEIHQENEEKYLGKITNKGVIEKIEYLTFVGGAGGNYHHLPQKGCRGIVCGRIGNKSYPIGELIFNP